MYFENIYQQHI